MTRRARTSIELRATAARSRNGVGERGEERGGEADDPRHALDGELAERRRRARRPASRPGARRRAAPGWRRRRCARAAPRASRRPRRGPAGRRRSPPARGPAGPRTGRPCRRGTAGRSSPARRPASVAMSSTVTLAKPHCSQQRSVASRTRSTSDVLRRPPSPWRETIRRKPSHRQPPCTDSLPTDDRGHAPSGTVSPRAPGSRRDRIDVPHGEVGPPTGRERAERAVEPERGGPADGRRGEQPVVEVGARRSRRRRRGAAAGRRRRAGRARRWSRASRCRRRTAPARAGSRPRAAGRCRR